MFLKVYKNMNVLISFPQKWFGEPSLKGRALHCTLQLHRVFDVLYLSHLWHISGNTCEWDINTLNKSRFSLQLHNRKDQTMRPSASWQRGQTPAAGGVCLPGLSVIACVWKHLLAIYACTEHHVNYPLILSPFYVFYSLMSRTSLVSNSANMVRLLQAH